MYCGWEFKNYSFSKCRQKAMPVIISITHEEADLNDRCINFLQQLFTLDFAKMFVRVSIEPEIRAILMYIHNYLLDSSGIQPSFTHVVCEPHCRAKDYDFSIRWHKFLCCKDYILFTYTQHKSLKSNSAVTSFPLHEQKI